MRLRFTYPGVRRTWTAELRPQPGGPVLVCHQCAHDGQPLNGPSARAELLAHLALHARRTPLPAHLRTCQCHERGCCWHPRHRGCEGPIRLLLARAHGGRLWRLTDACTACAAATSQASVVPDTTLTEPSSPTGRTDTRRSQRHSRGPDSHTRVREMLSYLATALPTVTPAAARLIALQCALRVDDSARVRLPLGVLRSLRMDPSPGPWQELEQAGWLRRVPLPSSSGKPAVVAQVARRGTPHSVSGASRPTQRSRLGAACRLPPPHRPRAASPTRCHVPRGPHSAEEPRGNGGSGPTGIRVRADRRGIHRRSSSVDGSRPPQLLGHGIGIGRSGVEAGRICSPRASARQSPVRGNQECQCRRGPSSPRRFPTRLPPDPRQLTRPRLMRRKPIADSLTSKMPANALVQRSGS